MNPSPYIYPSALHAQADADKAWQEHIDGKAVARTTPWRAFYSFRNFLEATVGTHLMACLDEAGLLRDPIEYRLDSDHTMWVKALEGDR